MKSIDRFACVLAVLGGVGLGCSKDHLDLGGDDDANPLDDGGDAAANDDGANGDGAFGDATSGDGANGDGATGDGANGDGATGDGANGDGANGDGANGDGATGDGANGDGGDGGTIVTGTWKIVGGRYFESVRSAWMSPPNDLWTVADGATMHFDGKWLAVSAVDSITKIKVVGIAPNDVWILGLAFATGDSLAMHFDGAKWTTTTIAPKGSTTGFVASDLWASSPTNAWAAGLSGGTSPKVHTFHFDGSTWSEVTVPDPGPAGGNYGTTPHLFGFAGDPDVWLTDGVSNAKEPTGELFHAGAWTPFNVPPVTYALDGSPDKFIFGTSPSDMWIASDMAIWHSDGASWTTSLPLDENTQNVYSALALASNDVWVGGVQAFRHFNGTSWSSFPNKFAVGPYVPLAGVSANDVRSFTLESRLRWDGSAWKVTWNDSQAPFHSFACVSANECFAAGQGAVQRWDGEGWKNESGAAGNAVFATGANDVWAVGTGAHAHFDGTTWTTMPAIGSDDLTALWGSSPSDYWAVGGTALEHFDGKGWTNLPAIVVTVGSTSGNAYLQSVWGSASNDVYAVGSIDPAQTEPVILHFDGTLWKQVQGISAAGALRAVYGLSAHDVYVVGDAGTLLHFDGTKWASIAAGDAGNFHSVWASGDDDVWIGGTELVHFDGSVWSHVNVPGADPYFVHAFGGARGAMWAANNAGDLLRFD